MKNTKGITLIALVITIIVLLILAGVSINMLSGNNSILQKASLAKQISQEADAEESLKIAIAGLATNYYALGNNQGSFRNYIFSSETGKGQDQLKAELGEDQINFDLTKNQITCKGQTFDIAENGTVTLRKPADPNQGFWINDTQISTHSLAEILDAIDDYLIELALNGSNIPNLAEYGISSISAYYTSDYSIDFFVNFTEYSTFQLEAAVLIETDPETGNTRLLVNSTHSPTNVIYKSPEITNTNDNDSLDNGFATILRSIDAPAFYNIVENLNIL